MTSADTPFLAALARITLVPAPALAAPLGCLGSARRLWQAPLPALMAAGLKPAAARVLVRERQLIDPDRELAFIYKEGVGVLTKNDEGYPPQLRELPGAPSILFYRGTMAALAHSRLIAMVGTRRVTVYGETTARLICRPLAAAGVGIVSGLALGVDAVVHETVLDAGGLTVAVLGSGVDRASIGPKSNAGLAERIIAAGGAVVSEYPPGVEGLKHHFPLRNRIIAGLASGTVVVEAAMRSGALITAAAALEHGRDVFAVPGPITQPTSAGANDLLRQGAVPLASAAELMKHYGWPTGPGAPDTLKNLDPDERLVCRALSDGPLPTEVLAARTGLDISRFVAAAARLEISGLMEKIGDQWAPKFDSPGQRRLI